MRRVLEDSFKNMLPTDRKNRNRRLIFCGFCVIISIGAKSVSLVKQKRNLKQIDK